MKIIAGIIFAAILHLASPPEVHAEPNEHDAADLGMLKSHFADLIKNQKWDEAAKEDLKGLLVAKKLDARFALTEIASQIHKHDESQFVSLLVIEEAGKTIDLLQASLDQPIQFNAEAIVAADSELKNQAPGQSISPRTQATVRLEFLEAFMRDIATLLHQKAKSTPQAHLYDAAVSGYKQYLLKFPKSPKSLDIHFNLAEALFKGGQWLEAGAAYQELAHDRRLQKRAAKFLESAIESYTNALARTQGADDEELHQARQGLRESGEQWLAIVGPQNPGAATVSYNIANSWNEDHDFKKARDGFMGFIELFPGDNRVRNAVLLTFESYANYGDPLGLEKFGKRMLKYKDKLHLDKNMLMETLHRTESKLTTNLAGSANDPAYADRMMALASQYAERDYAIIALRGAFETLKSKRDPRIYKIAEMIIDVHDRGPGKQATIAFTDADVKSALSTLATFSLSTAAAWQASEYLIRFATTYPREPESPGFLKTAANLEEKIGNLKRARKLFLKMGDAKRVAQVDFELRDWPALEKASVNLDSPDAAYWQALSVWRQHRYDRVKSQLRKATSVQNRDHAMHADFLLAQLDREDFHKIKMKSAEDQKSLTEKITRFKALLRVYQGIVEAGVGRWPIAALNAMAELQTEMGEFISATPIPKTLSVEQKRSYVKLLYQQAKNYADETERLYSKCLMLAENNDLFTRFAESCLSKGKIKTSEEDDTNIVYSESAGSEPALTQKIRERLLTANDKKLQIELLLSLAEAEFGGHHPMLGGAVVDRVLELDSTQARATSYLGFALLQRGDYDGACQQFKRALQFDPSEPTALWNLAGLYLHFHFQEKLDQLKTRMHEVQAPRLIYEWSHEKE